jgi:formate C-acetyltransferase
MFTEFSYTKRIEALRKAKQKQTKEKQEVIGFMDFDDHALILPPENRRKKVKSISGSGMEITDILLTDIPIKSNHENGDFYGAKTVGENFQALLENHPPYIDPMSSLAGGYMVNFNSYRKTSWNPDIDFSHLKEVREKYKLIGAIGAQQHFCQDMTIGLNLGWDRIRNKIERYRKLNQNDEFYDGLEAVVKGMQHWILHNAAEAANQARTEEHPLLKKNLEEIAAMNKKIAYQAPETFREACQWILWYDTAARMYNGSGSLGKLDLLLKPYYQKEKMSGTLTDEEALFHIACLLIRDTAYMQLGGPDKDGFDATNPVSYLILEAAHLLKIPANVGVCVGKNVDKNLLHRGVEIMLEDRLGVPKFLGVDNTIEGFMKNGYSRALANERAYSGCHWSAIPGKEYCINDCVKINFGVVFNVALRDMMDQDTPGISTLWNYFEKHLKAAVDGTAQSIDFHLTHMHKVFPELVLDLLCYGPIERGHDASDALNHGVDYYNMCIDGAALATVADSFAAVHQRIEDEQRLSWQQLMHCLDTNWQGEEGAQARLMMKNIRHFGYGGCLADNYAKNISNLFTRLVKERETPFGFKMIPGIFSWANTIPMGKDVGATPNGRYAYEPISHGANPDPGFREDAAPTAMASAIAEVQSGYGNTAPMQIELSSSISDIKNIESLIRTHFELGGTQINLNILDKEKLLAAHKDPSKYPDLVVRVTGFSAYFASLSPEMRQLVVNRYIS